MKYLFRIANCEEKLISLYGVVKIKLSLINGKFIAKDMCRIQRSSIKNLIIQERSCIYFSLIEGPNEEIPFKIPIPEKTIEEVELFNDFNWDQLPSKPQTDGYLYDVEARFYGSESKINAFLGI